MWVEACWDHWVLRSDRNGHRHGFVLWRLVYLYENMVFANEIVEFVFSHDLLGNGPSWDTYILVSFHGCVKIKIGYIETAELGLECR